MSVDQVVPAEENIEQEDEQEAPIEKKESRTQDRAASSASPLAANASGKKMAQLQETVALEVTVEDNIERAMKVLKRKLIKEGLFKELKSRRFYEKPSERRKRKKKESVKKLRKEASRAKKTAQLF